MSEEIEGDPIAHEDAIGRLLNSLRSGGSAALGLARSHLPGMAEASNTTLRARGFELEDAELAHARHYGFESWPALRVELFRAGLDGEQDRGPFVRAAAAIHAADVRRLERTLKDHPELVERGQGGKLDPLLVQAVGCRDVKSVGVLLEAGASVTEPAHCGCLAVHRAAYGHPPEARPSAQRAHRAILDVLLEANSPLDRSSHGEGGTPLAMALFWGHRTLAERLVQAGAKVPNLRAAAALGDLAACEGFFDGKVLRPEAGHARAFYRPHDGFPEWTPTDDPQEILDEAFVWSAKNGRHGSLAFLLERGANIDACPYDAPALMHTAGHGPFETVRWLIEQKANPSARGTFPRGATALHMAAAQGHLETVRLLVRKGASRKAKDEEFGADALGFAEWGGHADIIEFLSP